MNDAVIVRHKTSRDFTVLQNDVMRDQRLSWKALGLLAYLLHLPSDFRLRLSHLAKQRAKGGRSGRDATRSGLRELETSGYLTINRERGAGGKFTQVTWIVTDMPEHAPRSDFPDVDKPKEAYPATEKPTLINTNTDKERNLQRTTTTHGPNLHFPSMLGASERQAAIQLLMNVPAQPAQELLDELADAIESGTIKTNPLRWLRGVIQRYKKGDFVPTGAIRIAARRAADDQRRSAREASSKHPQLSDPAVARSHLDTIRRMTPRRSLHENT
ncbi:MAG: hypothetical protein VB131_07225 [Burkholderia gladioli]